MKDTEFTTAPKFAHCDELVVHAPQICRFCDEFPERQQERIRTNTNFTGEQDLTKNPCPAEKRRTLRDINKWQGNRPESYPKISGFVGRNGDA